ncbi:AraC family transcriptional regulator [Leucobacter sp. M11]|nr:AraC family transcriptional regulator [Leucobacter sp. M11]MEB4615184.1 AraC family transcriptional regulator [Leucobacter sp. M11]
MTPNSSRPAPVDESLQGADGLARLGGALPIRGEAPGQFSGRLRVVQVGAVRAVRLQHSPCQLTYDRGPETIGSAGMLVVAAHRSGRIRVQQSGPTSLVAPGQLSMVHSGAPFRYSAELPTDLLHVVIPLRAIGTVRQRALEELTACPVVTPLGLSAAAFIITLVRRLLAPGPIRSIPETERAVLAMLRAVLDEQSTLQARSAGPRNPAAMRQRVAALIERGYSDSSLDVAGIARALSVSDRQLQRSFEGVDYGPRELLGRRRAEALAQALRDPAVSVAQAADTAGFRSETAMRNQVRRRFGCSPAELRPAPEQRDGAGAWAEPSGTLRGDPDDPEFQAA